MHQCDNIRRNPTLLLNETNSLERCCTVRRITVSQKYVKKLNKSNKIPDTKKKPYGEIFLTTHRWYIFGSQNKSHMMSQSTANPAWLRRHVHALLCVCIWICVRLQQNHCANGAKQWGCWFPFDWKCMKFHSEEAFAHTVHSINRMILVESAFILMRCI